MSAQPDYTVIDVIEWRCPRCRLLRKLRHPMLEKPSTCWCPECHPVVVLEMHTHCDLPGTCKDDYVPYVPVPEPDTDPPSGPAFAGRKGRRARFVAGDVPPEKIP